MFFRVGLRFQGGWLSFAVLVVCGWGSRVQDTGVKVLLCDLQDPNTVSDNRPLLFKSWELGCLGFVGVGLGRACVAAAEPEFLLFFVFFFFRVWAYAAQYIARKVCLHKILGRGLRF